jgi:hypothetical protein
MSNPSREPYLNSSKLIDDKGTKGCLTVHPIMVGNEGGTAIVLGFSSYSGWSGGNLYVKPGQKLSSITTDQDKQVNPYINFTYYNMSPISIGLDFALRYQCTQCSGTMYSSCIGVPECLGPHVLTDTWSIADLKTTYYGGSGVSGVAVLSSAPITANVTMTADSTDMCPPAPLGTAYLKINSVFTINKPVINSFGGVLNAVEWEVLNLSWSGTSGGNNSAGTISSPVQYPYVDAETYDQLEVASIGFLDSFSGNSGFSGFSGASGFSAATGCSGT